MSPARRPNRAGADRSGSAALPPCGFVAVIGPSASGKSTLIASLAQLCGASIFRLCDYVHSSRPGGDPRLFAPSDRLGWLNHAAAEVLLREALLHGKLPSRGLMLLEGLPGSVRQAHFLGEIALLLAAPLVLVELMAADDVLEQRATGRRVCGTCGPDSRNGSHNFAVGASAAPDRCTGCGCPLRTADAPPVFAQRVERYRRSHRFILATARTLRLPHVAVDATTTADLCGVQVYQALGRIPSVAPLLSNPMAPG